MVNSTSSYDWRKLIRLTIAAIPIGVLASLLVTIFGKGLLQIGEIRERFSFYLLPFLALAGILIRYLYQKFGRQDNLGMGLIFEVAQGDDQPIPKRLIPLVIVTTWLTHLFGGSAGREGVGVQIGGAVAYGFRKMMPSEQDAQALVIIGMAAGFSGLFQTPLAAVCFALEVLVVGRVLLNLLVPTAVAALTASLTSHFLGLEKFSHPLLEQTLSFEMMLVAGGLGLVFGLAGNLFAMILEQMKQKVVAIIANPYRRIFIGGLLLSCCVIILHTGRYSGLGTNLIEASFGAESIYYYDWLVKLVLTCLTLAIGFQGGEVTPLFAIGASLGAVLANSFGLPVELIAAMGYISVFGAATNTFWAPLFIGGEVFGFSNMPLYFMAVAVAVSLSQRWTIYPNQKRPQNAKKSELSALQEKRILVE